ncbi:hypothetical protein ES703_06395 [subsurface metagenome]
MERGKIALERAEKIAAAVVKRLAPYCKKKEDSRGYYIEVVGSIRRRKPWVKDIDIVLIGSDFWNLTREILAIDSRDPYVPLPSRVTTVKLRRINYYGTQVDLYFATEHTWATLLLIRTGSAQNNIRLCSRAKELGYHLHASGEGLFNKGERIAGDTELSIYNALGLPWQRPRERG